MSEPVGSQDATEAVAQDGEGAAAGNGAAGDIAVANPATGETIATVPEVGADEVAGLVAAARAAQPAWAEAGFDGRAEVLLAARRWLVDYGERLVEAFLADTGRTVD